MFRNLSISKYARVSNTFKEKLTQKDGAGNITTFEYNVANKVSKKIYSAGMNKEVSYTYYGNGLEKESVDRNGIKTTSEYDIHGRLISQKNR